MRFEVTHLTKFIYSRPVFLEPHEVRLRPRCDSWQNLLSFKIHVDPSPAGITHNIDLHNNSSTRMWFNGTHKSLIITTAFSVETLRTDPFDFIVDSQALVLPVNYSDEDSDSLAPFREVSNFSVDVKNLAKSISNDAKNETLAFLVSLNQRIHETIEPIFRAVGDPWPASTTLEKRKGSCRDQSVLFIAVCRTVGLAARFVSGYQEGDYQRAKRELHAWAEVYLPGAGWRGYDPMSGLVISDRHVAVASGHIPSAAAPTSGTFRGTNVESTMRTQIDIEVQPVRQV
ncbi:MAG: transglutaminase family protein [Chloroflexi bacterium]|nr:transglutaminase family protein [Chloroflexota bacterium]